MPDASEPGLSFAHLIAYTSGEQHRWHGWFQQHADLLRLPYAEAPLESVGALVRHIGFVEARYAAILEDRVPPASPTGPAEMPDVVFAELRESRTALERAVAVERDPARTVRFTTLTAGERSASARKVIAHALLHGIRHWAQLATVLRAHGHPTDWPHDFLLSDALA